MDRDFVRSRIRHLGILPAVRTTSRDDARYAIDAVASGGIPIAELTLTVSGAVDLIAELRRERPELIIGAGTVLTIAQAKECLEAGAVFLSSPGLDLEIVEMAQKNNVAVIPGALTPTEVNLACKAGVDFVKVFPCAPVGGPSYIRALKAPFRDAALIASGGVNQQNAVDFIYAGAAALGIGGELIPRDAVERRQTDRIHELARRFLTMVEKGRHNIGH
jgi:2-dehydro-3-deoxyphosphogluconate aldolase/(4S)-4-hydroxy-2-oxoglutarate aldolase